MHALRQYTGFTGLLTGLWRNTVQHHLADIVFVLLAYVSVKLKKQNKIKKKYNVKLMMIYKRFATEYLVVGRYQEKDGATDLTVQLNVTELNKIPRNLF